MARRLEIVLLAALVASTPALFPSAPTAEAAGVLESYLAGLDWPVALAFAGDGRVFYAERLTGNVRIIVNGALSPSPFYALPDAVSTAEDGLLGLALDPGFPGDPWVYVYHSYEDAGSSTVYNRVVRIRAAGDAGVSHEVLLDRIPHGDIHNGGPIAFGPDGRLYVLTGDATFLGEPATIPQDLASLGGKVLRLNRDGTIPADNPFVGVGDANPYVYTYGHRSQFGLAFHPVTHRLFTTENGPDCNDEVNLLIPGRNYGWGPNQTCSEPPTAPSNTNQDGPDPVLPLVWYSPPVAPTNALIYGGPSFAEFQGDLIFGDFNTGSLWHVDLEEPNYDRVVGQSAFLHVPNAILDVEEGPDGAIWFTTPSEIFRYVDSARHPRATFTATPGTAEVGEPVLFDASGSSDPDGTIVAYEWDFGDGIQASGVRVTHSYVSAGTYDVRLTVVDNTSRSASAVHPFVVRPPPEAPVAAFSVSPVTPGVGEPVLFDASGSSDPDGTIVSYEWDFGDGIRGSGVQLEHTYDSSGPFTVTLTVIDNASLSAIAVRRVQVGAPGQLPLPAFSITPSAPIVGETVFFDGSASVDANGSIVSHTWDFGDGGTASGVLATHAFQAWGTFSVALTVEDNEGFSDTVLLNLRVNALPTAFFVASPSPAYLGMSITFDATLSSDPDDAIVTYDWAFGDGGSAAGIEVTHIYAAKGTFPVTLRVADEFGAVSHRTETVVIGNRAPSITSSSPPDDRVAIRLGEGRTFSVHATDPDGDVLTYVWAVDGLEVSGSESSLAVLAETSGTHRVNVTVTDGEDATWHEWTILVDGTGPSGLAALPWFVWLLPAALLGGVYAARVFVRSRGRTRP